MVRGSAKLEFVQGAACCVCDKPPVDALDVPSVIVCRSCASAIGRFLEESGDAVLSVLWLRSVRPIRSTRREWIDADAKALQTHFDLGLAYAEMGLSVDAIREFAMGLRPTATNALASNAFYRIFLAEEARPEALGDLILAFKRELVPRE